MTKKDFMDRVVHIKLNEDCTTSEAIDKAEKELHVPGYLFIQWFGVGRSK